MYNRITALELQRKKSNRINIFLDGKFAFSLNDIVAAWLKVGDELSDEKINSLKDKDSIERGLQSALHFLSYRNRSEHEIRKNLLHKGFLSGEIEKILQAMKDRELINDNQFAVEWVENRTNSKPRGRMLLSYELTQKKIAPELIRQALAELPDESTLALSAGHKILNRYANLNKKLFFKKMLNYLLRRGFNYEVAYETVSKLWGEI